MKTILFIEDESALQKTFGDLFKSENFEMIPALDGESGLKLAKEKKPDLIILDVMMDEPDDGFFLAQKFRKEKVKTPILMYTSVSKAIGFEFGAGEMVPVDDFVEKPISPDEIIEKVSRLLN